MGDTKVKTAERNLEKTEEWIRSFDKGSTTREAKLPYCGLKVDEKRLRHELEDVKAREYTGPKDNKEREATWKKQNDTEIKTAENKIAINQAKISSLDSEM